MISAFEPVTAADLGLPSPQVVSAAIPLFVAGLLMGFHKLPRVAACFTLLAGAALTTGWLYDGIKHGLGWVTSLVDAVTRTTTGGVVPGAVAIVLTIVFVRELWPDEAALSKATGLRDRLTNPRSLVVSSRAGGYARAGGRGRHGEAALAARPRRGLRIRRPEKLGAAVVGLVLPSVVSTIPGMVGASATTVVNVVGALFAYLVAQGFGIS